ncbi:uncharacterized protein [Gossypium hirsutum]|uniref:Reverse transcriptase RNase H-like domain-containing protein n=1 Tax=Gossypium hirsutum TaxID=3635 RepID=A0ABM3A0B7_GOSHI|nr:uncharacterized protein LOC121216882 [Gossypium hirsutum]
MVSSGNHTFLIKEATVQDLQLAFEKNQLTSRQLVEFYMGEIHRLNELLRAVMEVNPDALYQANEADRAQGVVSKLRKAGAIILGKVSLSEWPHFRNGSVPSGWCARTGQEKLCDQCYIHANSVSVRSTVKLLQLIFSFFMFFFSHSRLQERKIPLIDVSKVVKVKPYRYPVVQKTEIEKLVQEMLQAGIIRNNNSPFASPMVMEPFCVEMDASGQGVGAILQQNGRLVAYFRKALGVKYQALSIYDKKMLAVLLAVKKCHPYLVSRHFFIKTDHQSLKFLSE